MPSSPRRALMARVDKHNGHWIWTGSTNADGLPVLDTGNRSVRRSARRVAWELCHGPTSHRLVVTCGEPDCIAPKHMRPWDDCPSGHQSERYPSGQCKECQRLQAARKTVCPECGIPGAVSQRARHRKTCKGRPKVTQQHRSQQEIDQLVQEVCHQSKFGTHPEDIASKFSTTVGALEILLRRQGRQDLSNYLTRA